MCLRCTVVFLEKYFKIAVENTSGPPIDENTLVDLLLIAVHIVNPQKNRYSLINSPRLFSALILKKGLAFLNVDLERSPFK